MENKSVPIKGKTVLSVNHCRLPNIGNILVLVILSMLMSRCGYFNYNTDKNSLITKEDIYKYFYPPMIILFIFGMVFRYMYYKDQTYVNLFYGCVFLTQLLFLPYIISTVSDINIISGGYLLVWYMIYQYLSSWFNMLFCLELKVIDKK